MKNENLIRIEKRAGNKTYRVFWIRPIYFNPVFLIRIGNDLQLLLSYAEDFKKTWGITAEIDTQYIIK